MSDYAKQAVDMYVKAAPHAKLKQASTPFAPEGSLWIQTMKPGGSSQRAHAASS